MTKNSIKTTVSSISPVWLVPLVALLLGLWMLYQYQSNKGIEISITADNAEGIVVGKTEIRVRSVNVGTVKGIRLNQGHDHVLISAQIKNQYKSLLKSDTQIWMVKPRVDLTGVSGLGTLLSGVYLELQPGQLDASSESFELLDRPPLIGNEVSGKRYTLNSFDNN